MAAAGRAMVVKRGMRKLNEEAASLVVEAEAEAGPAEADAERALSSA